MWRNWNSVVGSTHDGGGIVGGIVEGSIGDRVAVDVGGGGGDVVDGWGGGPGVDGVEDVEGALDEGSGRVQVVVLHRNPSPHFLFFF